MPTDAGGDGDKKDSKPKGQVALAAESGGVWFLLLGFFCFGGVIGGITGLSSWDGISNTLLTSLCTFVGGSLLGFGGFVRGVKDDVAYVSGKRLGGGLICFSLGIALGLSAGTWIRLEHGPPLVDAKGNPVPKKLLHGENRAACEAITEKFATKVYESDRALPEVRQDLEWLARLSCPSP